jgi:thioesterase domain-containing protein
MRSVHPHGPYVLAGHSFGGLVALEMARQLRRDGEEIALLAVLDSFPPDPALVPPRPPLSPLLRVKDAVGLAVTGLVPTPGIGQYWRFHRQSHFLSRRYRPEPYAGRTLVLVAESPEREVRAQWGPHLTGPWRLREITGDHHSMLRDPHLAGLAAALTEELDQLSDLP